MEHKQKAISNAARQSSGQQNKVGETQTTAAVSLADEGALARRSRHQPTHSLQIDLSKNHLMSKIQLEGRGDTPHSAQGNQAKHAK